MYQLNIENFTQKVDMEKLIPGEVLAFDILLPSGALILEAGVVLTEQHLQKLKRMSDKLITINYRDIYTQAMTASQDILEKARNSEPIPKEEASDLMEPFVAEVQRHSFVSQFLLNMNTMDDYTLQHTFNVGVLSLVLGRWLGYKEEELTALSVAGLLHDIGKSKVPLELINKPDKLTDEEFENVKKHSKYGYELLLKTGGYDEGITMGVLQHHERGDGSGYPLGLGAEKIHPYAKVIAVADTYHAMTTDRLYQKKKSPFFVLNDLKQSMHQLDPRCVLCFVDNMMNYFQGCRVVLNNQRKGQVIFIDPQSVAYPLIKLDGDGEIIELRKRKDLEIIEVITSRALDDEG